MEREIERQSGQGYDLVIEKGAVFVYYAFDVGSSIEIDQAERMLAGEKKKTPAQDTKRQAKYFEFTPPPLRWIEETSACPVGPRFQSLPTVEMLLFDFGCVSVRFEIPIAGPIQDMIGLSVDLYENVRLKEAATGLANKLIDKIKSAVDKPQLAPRVEDYSIFHFSKFASEVSVADLLEKHVEPMACLLRAETGASSDREVQEILSERISYGFSDVTLMSWHGAVIYGENAEDIYAVLEFANLLLLELSYLDSNLDRSLDQFYDYFTEQRSRRRWLARNSNRPWVHRISELQIESAILFERTTNALKLMGDDFQARVFRLASKKMGLSAWDASISRKLQTIESIYKKISDAEGARRMEVLEIIVILLILVSILVSTH